MDHLIDQFIFRPLRRHWSDEQIILINYDDDYDDIDIIFYSTMKSILTKSKCLSEWWMHLLHWKKIHSNFVRMSCSDFIEFRLLFRLCIDHCLKLNIQSILQGNYCSLTIDSIQQPISIDYRWLFNASIQMFCQHFRIKSLTTKSFDAIIDYCCDISVTLELTYQRQARSRSDGISKVSMRFLMEQRWEQRP